MSQADGSGSFARWQVIIGAAGLVLVVAGALIAILMTINTQGSTIASLSARLSAVELDRSHQQDRDVALQAAVAGIQRDLIEVDSQLCAEDAVRNLTHANDLRDIGFLWKRVLGDILPTDNAYYPRIGRCLTPQETR